MVVTVRSSTFPGIARAVVLIGLGSAVTYAAIRIHRAVSGFPELAGVFDEITEDSAALEDAGDSVQNPADTDSSVQNPADLDSSAGDSGEALAQVTAYARQHAVFRRNWETAVRQAADVMAATIAGRWMAGQAHGSVEWFAAYPVLSAIDARTVEAAFQLAVHHEVTRRIRAMEGPGSFG